MSDASRPATPATPKHPLLSHGPLYAFALPQELLDVIALRAPLGGQDLTNGSASHDASNVSSDAVQGSATPTPATSSLSCSQCGIVSFDSISEQRTHFGSDWHRFNVKRKLAHKAAVSHHDFEEMVQALSDSLTGSASSSSSEDDSDADLDTSGANAVTRILAKQDLNGHGDPDDEKPELLSQRSPLLWFDAVGVVQDTQFGIYRTIFPSAVKKATESPWLDELRRLQVTEDATSLGKKAQAARGGVETDSKSRIWTLLAVGGGHFAGIVVSLVPRLTNRNGRVEKEVVILQSKTYHRYTTRRKQGGAQSANDNAKGKAKSAGAQIRRYNEAMLRDEIRQLLTDWKEYVDKSELVFIRAGKTSHRIFYDYDDAVLDRKDNRIRSFPFPTRRPTQAELIRCFTELTRVKLSHLTAAQLRELDDAYRAAMAPKPKPVQMAPKLEAAKPAVPKFSAEELLERDRWDRIIDMVQRGRLDAALTFFDKQAAEGRPTEQWTGLLPSWVRDNGHNQTLLHVASANDQADVARWLLESARADPTLTVPVDDTAASAPYSRTAYEVSASRAVRNAFRRCYADHPEWYSWTEKAKVPSPLTEEMEGQQAAKGKDRKTNLKAKMREKAAEREAERAAEEDRLKQQAAQDAQRKEEERRAVPDTRPQRLGGGAPQKVLEQTELRGLTAEARMRLERERRARAAEARMQGR